MNTYNKIIRKIISESMTEALGYDTSELVQQVFDKIDELIPRVQEFKSRMSKLYRAKKQYFRQKGEPSRTPAWSSNSDEKEIQSFIEDIYHQISQCSYAVNLKLGNYYFEARCKVITKKLYKLTIGHSSNYAKAVTAATNAIKYLNELKALYQEYLTTGKAL